MKILLKHRDCVERKYSTPVINPIQHVHKKKKDAMIKMTVLHNERDLHSIYLSDKG